MIKSYLKAALRSLLKDKVYSMINILGLSFGLAAFLLIYFYVDFERSYDDFHQDADQLYRVTTDNVVNGVLGVRDAMSFNPQGAAMKEELPEVIDYTTTFKWFRNFNVRIEDEIFMERPVLAVDTNFLRLFSYPIVAGNKTEPLKEPFSMVLTRSIAEKYFGDEDPVGKTVMVHSGMDKSFKITGVVEDPPQNTHYKFDMLFSINSIQDRLDEDGWNGFNYYTYLKISKDADIDALKAKMPELTKKYLNAETTLVFNLQKMRDIHLHSNFTFEPEVHGNARTVGFLAIIAFSILIIAWVNYINLSTAKSMERAREVGMRKVVGASKSHLITQFLSESLLINLISLCLAITFVQILFPFYKDLLGYEGIPDFWERPGVSGLIIVLFLTSSFLSGFYPSLVLSSYRPVSILRGKFRTSVKGAILRKSLVVFQFATSSALIAGTIIVYYQIQFMQNQDIGVDISRVVSITDPQLPGNNNEENEQRLETYKDDLRKITGIEGVSTASNVPDGGLSFVSSNSGGMSVVGDENRYNATVYISWIDAEFCDLMGIEFMAGRNFVKDMVSDTSSLIINESLLTKLNFSQPEEAIGKKIQIGSSPDAKRWLIVGVIRDFNRQSLKHAVEPTTYRFDMRGGAGYTVVKMVGTNVEQIMNAVRNRFQTQFPNAPFQYAFLDEQFEQAYRDEKQFGSLFGVFASLAIFIACLGLFGLSSFMANQKTKEIGVRKVLGASVQSIVVLLYQNFLMLVIISMIISLPVIYFIMDTWLDNYSFRINMPWWVFIISTSILLLVSFITVSYQTLKAALANPVRSLRYE